MQEKLQKRCVDYAGHISALCGVSCSVLDVAARSFVYDGNPPRFCRECGCDRCQELNTHLYGSSEAYRWNGQYIYYCPLGMVFTASSVSDDSGVMTGSLVAGPILMGSPEDLVAELPESLLQSQRLPVMEPPKVTHLASVLSACAAYAAGLPHSRAGVFVYEQERILSSIYDAREKCSAIPRKPPTPLSTKNASRPLSANGIKPAPGKCSTNCWATSTVPVIST